MNYNGSGTISFGGCSNVILVKNFITKFGVGSSVFVKRKAKQGILENLIIKNVIKQIDSPINYPRFNYLDNLNHVWLECELCWLDEAVADAIVYQTRIAAFEVDYINQ